MITQLDKNRPITKDGNMLEMFYQWMLSVSNLSTIVGTGSPEGVITARATRFYLQTDGTANQILWVKKLDDIAGDRSAGWELV